MACEASHPELMEALGSIRERVAKLEATIKTAGVITPMLTSIVTAFVVYLVTSK